MREPFRRERAFARAAALSVCILAASGAWAQSGSDAAFPAVTIVAGFGPGGAEGFAGAGRGRSDEAMRPQPRLDLTARLYGRHLGRFLPGRPTVSVHHMPGGQGRRALQWLAASGPSSERAATVAVAIAPAGAVAAIVASDGASPGFAAIGASASGERFCALRVREASGEGRPPPIFGATAAGETSVLHANALAAIRPPGLGVSGLRLIAGYANTTDIAFAWRRMEIDGFCGFAFADITALLGDDMAEGRLAPLVRFSPQGAGRFRHIPRAGDLAVDATTRAGVRALEHQAALESALLAHPKTPEPLLQALREAFALMLRDQTVRAEAGRWGLVLEHVPAKTVAAALAAIGVEARAGAPALACWRRPACHTPD